jgi:hypothetical protein
MIHLKPFGLTESQINEELSSEEKIVIEKLKADLDRLVKQKIAVTDFANNKYSQVDKNLSQILNDLSFIVADYATITEDGQFIAKPLNEIK